MKMTLTGRTGHPLLPELSKYRFAHRGFHDKPRVPENSLPAFRAALERGWGAELDVHLLKDGTLCVFHDSELFRCTGTHGTIEELDRAGLEKLRLEGTEEKVPLFDEVLALFERKAPLIIELKPHGGNHRELVRAVCERLDCYSGLFCIESFDPRALTALKKLRPGICRGQLSQNFELKTEGLPAPLRRPLARLWLNPLTRPDFIAYRLEDRQLPALRRCIDRRHLREFSWTVRSRRDLTELERQGCIPIFECFDPDKAEE